MEDLAARAKTDPLGEVAVGARLDFRGRPVLRVYEDEHVLAFLDGGGLEWSDGHTLLVPKQAGLRSMTELSEEAAAALGVTLVRLSKGVRAAMNELETEAAARPAGVAARHASLPGVRGRRSSLDGFIRDRPADAPPSVVGEVGSSIVLDDGDAAGQRFRRPVIDIVPRVPGDNAFDSAAWALMSGSERGGLSAVRLRFDPTRPKPVRLGRFPPELVQLAVLRHTVRREWGPLARIRLFWVDAAGKMLCLDNGGGAEANKQSRCETGPVLLRLYGSTIPVALTGNQEWSLDTAGGGLYSLYNPKTALSLCADGRSRGFLLAGTRVVLRRVAHSGDALRFHITSAPGRPGYVRLRVPFLLEGEAGGGRLATGAIDLAHWEDVVAEMEAAAAAEEAGVSRPAVRQRWLYLSMEREQPPEYNCSVPVSLFLRYEEPPESAGRQAFRVMPFCPYVHDNHVPVRLPGSPAAHELALAHTRLGASSGRTRATSPPRAGSPVRGDRGEAAGGGGGVGGGGIGGGDSVFSTGSAASLRSPVRPPALLDSPGARGAAGSGAGLTLAGRVALRP